KHLPSAKRRAFNVSAGGKSVAGPKSRPGTSIRRQSAMNLWQTSGSRSLTFLCALVLGVATIGVSCDSPERASGDQQSVIALPTLVHQGEGLELLQLQPNQLPDMTLTPVLKVGLPRVLETTGQITFNDRRVANIISRVAGRIEEVRVSQWDYVRRGQPILTLYSPDFMTAEAEYLQAKAAVPALGAGSSDDKDFARSMVEGAQRKLALLGIEPDQIEQI